MKPFCVLCGRCDPKAVNHSPKNLSQVAQILQNNQNAYKVKLILYSNPQNADSHIFEYWVSPSLILWCLETKCNRLNTPLLKFPFLPHKTDLPIACVSFANRWPSPWSWKFYDLWSGLGASYRSEKGLRTLSSCCAFQGKTYLALWLSPLALENTAVL